MEQYAKTQILQIVIVLSFFTSHSEFGCKCTFASREFVDVELMYVDKTLQELGILSPNDLYKIPAQELGRILGADALIYGKVTEYKNSYYLLYK